MGLEVLENKFTEIIAKNLLTGNICENCYHTKEFAIPTTSLQGDIEFRCTSLIRARREFGIVHIATPEWQNFKYYGLEFGEGNTCEYWESS